MALIVLLRHGRALNNARRVLAGRTPGFSLTPDGEEQARAAARMLPPLNISRIYCSPMERARQTAEIVSGETSAAVELDDRLLELEMGRFTGVKYDDLEPVYGNVFEKYYLNDPELEGVGIETFDAVRRRIASMTDHVLKNHPDENTLLVTHMDPIKAMIANVAGMRLESLCQLIIANASLNVFGHSDGEVYLKGINVLETTRFNEVW